MRAKVVSDSQSSQRALEKESERCEMRRAEQLVSNGAGAMRLWEWWKSSRKKEDPRE